MTDNFDLIRSLLKFSSADDFYFIQILKRRKDNPGLNTDVAVVKEYFVDSLDYFDKKREDMIEQAIKNNARVTIRLNKRSYQKTALKMLVEVANRVEQGQYKAVKTAFSTCAGKYSADKDKTWLIDVDSEDLDKYNMDEVINDINASMPVGEKVICKIPSKTGYHLLVKPFDLRTYSQKYPTLDIKKDNPTNLFIPFLSKNLHNSKIACNFLATKDKNMISNKLYTHQDLLNSTFKVEWLYIKHMEDTLYGAFRILSVGTTYYVTDMTNMLRDKLKSLLDKYEYLDTANIIFPENIECMTYSFNIKAKLKQSGG